MSMQVSRAQLDYFVVLEDKLINAGMKDDAGKLHEIIDVLETERKRHNAATSKRIFEKRKKDKSYARSKKKEM